MAVLKAPPKQPKTTVVQLRLDDEARTKLTKYAEFLDCSPSYVVTEALKLVYSKDKEFQKWPSGQQTTTADRGAARVLAAQAYRDVRSCFGRVRSAAQFSASACSFCLLSPLLGDPGSEISRERPTHLTALVCAKCARAQYASSFNAHLFLQVSLHDKFRSCEATETQPR
jgi:predicted transcriptional regulator